ncbi:putative immunoglobulin-blocking virulence protein [Mycoplasma sp. 'Moose RK']|nr:putative immunoglobulin-blocking virulence protein [Mycoplasma sp. 'Moose RK']MBG0730765.1 putative immunoglobulin-blocking virulence protein [Mycoplasma sp. 'Moose RK']
MCQKRTWSNPKKNLSLNLNRKFKKLHLRLKEKYKFKSQSKHQKITNLKQKVSLSLSLSPKKSEISRPKSEAKSPIINNPSTTQTNTRSSAPVSSSQIQNALERYKQGLAAEIKNVEGRVAALQAQVDEINRSYEEDFEKDHIRGKIPKTKAGRDLWKEIYQNRINLPKYNLEKEKAYLEELKRRAPKTSFTPEELKSLRQGLVPSTESPNVWVYEDENKNPTLNRLKQHNKNRTFNTPSWYGLTPDNISNGNFPGWTKSDVSGSFSSEISGHTNSIKVYEYTPNADNEDKSRQALKLIELDANDNNAFDKFKEIMSKISQKDNKVQAIRIKNIGETHSLQNAAEILKAIPSQINTVSVFLNNTNATKSLRGLENKKLKELSIYTEINSLNEEWTINPNALNNVDFISFDYNNQATFDPSSGKIGGSIIFQGLRWEKGDDINKINEGLSIVFDSKINQRVFQGNFGGKGGWPTTLDFSETDVNTFKNIKFNEFDQKFNEKVKNWKDDPYAKENYTGFRKLKFSKLIIKGSESAGSSKSLNFKFSDLDGAQFTERFSEPVPMNNPKVVVKVSGQQINSYPVYISGTPSGDAIEQLKKFIEVANGSGNNITQIFVENDSVRSQIGSTIGLAQVLVGKQSNGVGSNSQDLV